MAFMKYFRKLLHALGVQSHDWTDLIYEQQNQCNKARYCRTCEKREIRENQHIEKKVFPYKDKCNYRSICSRCGTDLNMVGIEHDWSEDCYISEDSCEIANICRRCEEVKLHGRYSQLHDWGEWKDSTKGPCFQERQCRRCKTKESKEEHSWEEWRHIENCTSERRCKICNKTEQHDDHDWQKTGNVVPWSSDDWVEEYECTRCGLTAP